MTVTSNNGFNQGDLIFQNKGDFQQLTSQASLAVFPNNVSQPVLSGPLGGIGGSIGFPMSSSSTNTSGGSGLRNVALLTNGNIVIVGFNNTAAFFTIYDTSFNIVVSRTTLPTTHTPSQNVAVIALTGGGFVVHFGQSSQWFAYAVYSNTGSVVSALTVPSDNFTANSSLRAWSVTALSNGGFVAGVSNSSSTTVSYYVFNSTGTKLYASTLGVNSSEDITITAGASGSFVVFYKPASGTNYQWYLISSTNTTLGSGTISVTGVSGANFSCATLSDGINVVLLYGQADNGIYGFRFLNTSTYAMGSETKISNPLGVTSVAHFDSIAVRSLSSGGFITLWQTNVSSIQGSQATPSYYYAVFNSSGTPLATSTQTAVLPVYKSLLQLGSAQRSLNTSLSTIESGGNLWLFFNPRAGGSPAGAQSYTNYVQLDLTNYNPVPSLGYTAPLGSVTTGTGAVSFSDSTPTKASYLPGFNSVTQINDLSVTATTPSKVANFASQNYDVCTLTNGNFVVAYRNDSTYGIFASVYSPTGVLLTTISVGTGVAANQWYSVRVTPLASGKFVVAYVINGTDSPVTLSVNIYSASYLQTNSFTITGLTIGLTSPTSGQSWNLGSISSDRFAIVSYPSADASIRWWVYSNSGIQLATSTFAAGAGTYPTAIQGHPSGGFTLAYNPSVSPSSAGLQYFGETSTNTFASNGAITFSGTAGTQRSYIAKLIINQFNEVYYSVPNYNSGTAGYFHSTYAMFNNEGAFSTVINLNVSANSNNMLSVPTPSGLRAYIEMISTSGGSRFGVVAGNGSRIVDTAIPAIRAANNSMTQVATPLYGNTVVLVYPNSLDNNFLSFSIITFPFNNVVTLNTASSVSNQVSFAGPNYPFVGVAASSAVAGGTGIVQTTGVATLNSNYSSSTPYQAFDSQTPSGLGVRGTIVGRNLNLLGNTQ
jgi:hypothetical protein